MNFKTKLIPVVLAAAGSFTLAWARADHTKPAAAGTGIAVVELFTSEGCSSCPPADAAMADLIKDSQGKPVFALAFHVDYWDSIGWADPFASAANTSRQSTYAKTLKIDSIYTPQAIVNGQREFVGSRRAELKDAVAAALAVPASGTATATAKRVDGGVSVDILTTGLAADSIINVAVVEDGLSSEVLRGENRGKTLAHEHVVRSFRSVAPDNDGHASALLPLVKGVVSDRSSIIVYAQRPTDLRVLAATEVAVPQ